MLTLYHGDTSVCAAKVRLTLIEKGLAWDGRLLDLNAGDQFKSEYLLLNPHAVVPTLVHDDTVVIESTIINEYLEETFPDPPLLPSRAADRARARLWTQQENAIHDAINTVTTAILFREMERKKTEQQRAARVDGMPDPARRRKWRELIEHGVESDLVLEALIRFARLFSEMETRLQNSTWLTGDAYGLADIGFVSYFHRLRMLGMASSWTAHFPNVTAWLERVCARESFAKAITDYISDAKNKQYLQAQAPTKDRILQRFDEALELLQATGSSGR